VCGERIFVPYICTICSRIRNGNKNAAKIQEQILHRLLIVSYAAAHKKILSFETVFEFRDNFQLTDDIGGRSSSRFPPFAVFISCWDVWLPVSFHPTDSVSSMTIDDKHFHVGSIARVPRTKNDKPLGKATIATFHEEGEGTVTILWESTVPQPLSSTSFLVTPKLQRRPLQEDEETTMELSRLCSLLDFEYDDELQKIDDSTNDAIETYKDRGDQLLRIGDPTSAIPYYELALTRSSVVSVGASILCSVQGYPKVAEIDCIEEDTLDVTFVDSGEDKTISRSDILICIYENKELWQERILLNLTRCLLQQADIDPSNRAKYLKAAVLACTLVLSLQSFHHDDSEKSSDIHLTAIQLRVKAYMSLSKWPHAIADAKRLTKLGLSQGRKLLDSIEREKKYQEKRDKKLVKAITQLIATATSESVSGHDDDDDDDYDAGRTDNTSKPALGTRTLSSNETTSFVLSSPFLIIFALAAAYIVQQAMR